MRYLKVLFALIFTFMFSTLPLLAQEAVDLPNVDPGVLESVINFFHSLAPASIVNPILAVLIFVGGLRFIFKPLVSLAKTYAASTESTKDDEFIAKLESSKVYQIIIYVIDLVASIKLPGKKHK